MKKIGLLLIVFSFIQVSSFAQDEKEQLRERIESQKIGFISEKLKLTPSEAQVFWPVYNEYQAALNELRSVDLTDEEEMADEADSDEMLDDMIEHEQKVLDIKKMYADNMKETIGATKTLQYFKSEREFKEQMIGSLNKRRSNQGGEARTRPDRGNKEEERAKRRRGN